MGCITCMAERKNWALSNREYKCLTQVKAGKAYNCNKPGNVTINHSKYLLKNGSTHNIYSWIYIRGAKYTLTKYYHVTMGRVWRSLATDNKRNIIIWTQHAVHEYIKSKKKQERPYILKLHQKRYYKYTYMYINWLNEKKNNPAGINMHVHGNIVPTAKPNGKNQNDSNGHRLSQDVCRAECWV